MSTPNDFSDAISVDDVLYGIAEDCGTFNYDITDPKKRLKELFLSIVDSIKPFEAEDGREFIPRGEITKEIMKL